MFYLSLASRNALAMALYFAPIFTPLQTSSLPLRVFAWSRIGGGKQSRNLLDRRDPGPPLLQESPKNW